MPKIKFNRDYATKNCPDDKDVFKEGKTYDVSDATARHFTSRNLAVNVDKAKEDEEADKEAKKTEQEDNKKAREAEAKKAKEDETKKAKEEAAAHPHAAHPHGK